MHYENSPDHIKSKDIQEEIDSLDKIFEKARVLHEQIKSKIAESEEVCIIIDGLYGKMNKILSEDEVDDSSKPETKELVSKEKRIEDIYATVENLSSDLRKINDDMSKMLKELDVLIKSTGIK